MGLRVNTNVEAFSAWRNLSATQGNLSTSMGRLASGLRIQQTKDDSAGLGISEQMRAQIRGTAQAMRNAQDGQSMLGTAEGTLGEMHGVLQRVRELAVQYANGTLTTADQGKVTAEIAQLTAELARLRDGSSFNGISLISSGDLTFTFQVGANANSDSASAAAQNRIGATVKGVTLTDIDTSAPSVGAIDGLIAKVSASRAEIGAVSNRLDSAISNLGVYQENTTAAESRIRDVDVASEMANVIRLQILSQAGTSMLAQANAAPQSVLPLLRG